MYVISKFHSDKIIMILRAKSLETSDFIYCQHTYRIFGGCSIHDMDWKIKRDKWML